MGQPQQVTNDSWGPALPPESIPRAALYEALFEALGIRLPRVMSIRADMTSLSITCKVVTDVGLALIQDGAIATVTHVIPLS